MQNGTLIKTIFLKASPEKVWAYLTEKDKLAEWFQEAFENFAEGDNWAFKSQDSETPDKKLCWGKVLEAKPYSRLVYTFTHDFMNSHETTVTWELEESCGGTQLVLTHSGLEKADEALDMLASHDKGWDDHFAKLREKLN